MAQPLVSIITMTYNRADLIHRCIESIQKQTYQNYEHIIADGNSSDNTAEVVQGYNDPHIKYLKLNQRGGGFQLRAGADVASGKYITFLDDDDEYLPEKIEKQVALFETLPEDYGVVYCWMSYYNYDNQDKAIAIHKTELRGDVGDIAVSNYLICGTPTMMIRREVFEKYGVTYRDDIGYPMSDWELMTRIVQHCKVDYVPESLIKVYVNHGHARLSSDFYGEKARRGILFHNHFLTEFSNVFERHPEYARFHYYQLSRCHAKLKHRKDSIRYLMKYMKYSPNFKESFKAIVGIILAK